MSSASASARAVFLSTKTTSRPTPCITSAYPAVAPTNPQPTIPTFITVSLPWSNLLWITTRLWVLCLDEQQRPLLSALARGPPGIRDEGGPVRHPVHTQEGFR